MLVFNLLALAAAIERSQLLTAPERAYWAARLGRMTTEQLGRLDTLLRKAEEIPWTKKALDFVASCVTTSIPCHA